MNIRMILALLLSTLIGPPASAFVKGASTPPNPPAKTVTFNLTFNTDAMTRDQAYRDAFTNAAAQFTAVMDESMTLNITVGYNTTQGGSGIPSNNCVSTGAFGFDNYPAERAALVAHLNSSHGGAAYANGLTTVTLGGQASFLLVTPWKKATAYGGYSPTDPSSDGYMACGSDYITGGSQASFITTGILHELGHILGRQQAAFPWLGACFSGGAGTWVSDPNCVNFSIDGGNTVTATFNQAQDNDLSWLVTGPQGLDSQNAIIGASTPQTLTAADLKMITSLGFNLK